MGYSLTNTVRAITIIQQTRYLPFFSASRLTVTAKSDILPRLADIKLEFDGFDTGSSTTQKTQPKQYRFTPA
jgi:hypothetical protein